LFFSLLRSDQLQSPPSLSNRYEDLFLVGWSWPLTSI
jgi:hypothetical protein